VTALFDLSDHVALVTGGNGGIGLGMATGLAKAGARVAIWGRNKVKNDEALAILRSHGCDAMSLVVDVGEEQEVVEGFAATVGEFGRVNSVFANAGVGAGSTRFADMTTEEWQDIFRVNVEGVFWTFREAVNHMQPLGGGSLVVTSSIAGEIGFARGQHYAATKAAVKSMVRSIAVEYGKHGIRANAVAPGWVVTGMTDGFIEGERFERNIKPRIPLGEWGRPGDFEGIAVYLASDASRWHTADTITIDGGYLWSG